MLLKDLIKYQIGGLTSDRIQQIINKYGGGKSPFTAKDYIEVANTTGVPVDVLLAQGIQESNLGTQGRAVRTKNVGNVGNTDDGTATNQGSWINGLYRQATLLKKEYGASSIEDVQRLINTDFTRPTKGGKYATASNYGSKVGNLINSLYGRTIYNTKNRSNAPLVHDSKNRSQQTEKKKDEGTLPPMNGGSWRPMGYIENTLPQSSINEDRVDFWSLPSDTQNTIIENQKLQEQLLAQEAEADKLEKENLAIEQGLKQKHLERQQLLNSIPQAQFIGDNSKLQPNPFTSLLQETQYMQMGGRIQINNMHPAYKDGILDAINYEKGYINSPKFKERADKQGYDSDQYKKRMQRKFNNIKISDTNIPGSYGAFNVPGQAGATEIYVKNGDEKGLEDTISKIISHELGHEFDNSNIEPFIDSINPLASKSKSGRLLQKLDYFNPLSSTQSNSHEADYDEVVADVHSSRYELSKISSYDGRYSNFTNEAYNKMRQLAINSSNTASSRLFNKLMSPEMKRYNQLYEKLMTEGIEFEKLPKNDQDFMGEYEKNIKKHNDIQKRNIFDVMNKVVSNTGINNSKQA